MINERLVELLRWLVIVVRIDACFGHVVVLKWQHLEVVYHAIETFFVLLHLWRAMGLNRLVHHVVFSRRFRPSLWFFLWLVATWSFHFDVLSRKCIFFATALILRLELGLTFEPQHCRLALVYLWLFSLLVFLFEGHLFNSLDVADRGGVNRSLVGLFRNTALATVGVSEAFDLVQLLEHGGVKTAVLECEQRLVHLDDHVVFGLEILLELVPFLEQVIVRAVVAGLVEFGGVTA